MGSSGGAPNMASRANGEHHQNDSDGQRRQQQRRPHLRPPQPSSHYLATYSSSSSSAASLKGCCCCLFLLLTFLALLVVAVALVVVLVVKPKKPQFDLQQVGVSYLLVTAPAQPQLGVTGTGAGAAAAYLTLNITMEFTAENPNKVGIRYGASRFTVMYRGVPLGAAELPGFEQPAHSTRLVQTRVVVDRVDVLQADALQLVRDAAIDDRVDLRIAGDVAARIRFLGLTSPRVQVSVDCAIAISPRRQSLTYKQCGVDGLNV